MRAAVTAVLIPLYRPHGRQLLLLKSVLSACRDLDGVRVIVAADGPSADAAWPAGSLASLIDYADCHSIDLRVFSYLEAAGYPGCYARLVRDALEDPSVATLHFIDQDDYCLPERFATRRLDATQACACLIVDGDFMALGTHHAIAPGGIPVLETPSPGMTFSVDRATAEQYLAPSVQRHAGGLPHDYVMAQIARRAGALSLRSEIAMLYLQHDDNTIGHYSGWRWIARKVTTLPRIMRSLKVRAAWLDTLYGGREWPTREPLHRKPWISSLYRLLLREH